MDPFIGQISSFGFNFAPKNWMLCQGQLLAISQNTALFSLLGTQYGGNGQTTFALPDLRGRLSVSQGQGPGLSPYVMGEVTGTQNETLLVTNLPAHVHTMSGTTTAATATPPANAVYLAGPNGEDANLGAVTVKMYGPPPVNTTLAPQAIGFAGQTNPVSILQPLLCINFSICVSGIFPSRN